jgi:hypothetical protein
MNKLKKILESAQKRKGQYAGLLWNRPLATRKDVLATVTKEVRCVARLGINYENMASTKEGRENGKLPAENAGLPWGVWDKFPYTIAHKGQTYLRLYPLTNGKVRTIYRINGKMAKASEAKEICLAKEFSKGEPSSCLTVNLANIVRIR